jgi:hypothetical protein
MRGYSMRIGLPSSQNKLPWMTLDVKSAYVNMTLSQNKTKKGSCFNLLER